MNIVPPILLGFIATSFQIFLLREFSSHFAGNEMIYGLLLGSWLLWGGLGSISASRLRYTSGRFLGMYYAVLLLFGVGLAGLRLSRFAFGILPGEATGLGPAFLAALILSLLVNFPLGILFVFNVKRCNGDLVRVYLFESLGAAVAGAAVYLFLIPYVSNWAGVSFIGVFSAFLLVLTLEKSRQKILFPLTLIFFGIMMRYDFPTQKLYWKPYMLSAAEDSPYGKLQILKDGEQISLYSNGIPLYSQPYSEAAEEAIHFALLQRPDARRALLIGGVSGGGIQEALKYPGIIFDGVEIDPAVIRISAAYLSDRERRAAADPRVRMITADGRSFLENSSDSYSAILLNLPGPATTQINRFYTKEFFELAGRRLTPDGILSFRLESAENYISPELARLLGTVYHTLKSAFPFVEIVPGATNIFLASRTSLSLDFDILARRIEILGIHNVYVTPQLLPIRLNPFRVRALKDRLEFAKPVLNSDRIPVSVFENALLWSTRFRSPEKKILSFLSRIPRFWALDAPLMIFVLALVTLRLKKKGTSFALVPLAVMGLTTMAVEILILILFQSIFGSVYSRIAGLLSAFMAGLFLGAFAALRLKKTVIQSPALLLGGFIALLVLTRTALGVRTAPVFFYAILLFYGFLGGFLFIVSNRMYLAQRNNYGLGYGLDLLGSFLGAIAVSSFIIPLFGMSLLLKYLILINSFCLLFLVSGAPRFWKSG